MPQLSSGGGDDLGANDEMISFKEEGEQEEKSRESRGLTERDLAELKTSLVSESEGRQQPPRPGPEQQAARRAQDAQRAYQEKLAELMEDGLKHQDGGMFKSSAYSSYPFLMLSDPCFSNGPMSHLSNKVPVVQPSHGVHPLTPLIPYSNEHFSHGSHSPHLPADVNQKSGVHRPSQSPDLSGFYSLPPGSVGQMTPSMGWFTHPLMLSSGMHPSGIPHPAIMPHSGKQDLDHYERIMKPQPEPKKKEPKKPTIKKPLNAFMLYMKEMRAKVIAECTLKESAAINQILGRRWHALSREEQAKYYELARKERQLHMQLYPGWSARDNYGKKKRRTREKQQDSNPEPGSPKKCRARFGLSQQTDWCGPCRRKKKCIRNLQGRCGSPASSDGSALDFPSSPVDVFQSMSPSAFTSDEHARPADFKHKIHSRHLASSNHDKGPIDLRTPSHHCNSATQGLGSSSPSSSSYSASSRGT
ncbi:transcription factor 7 isoform X2 [Lissotriton helveticus]